MAEEQERAAPTAAATAVNTIEPGRPRAAKGGKNQESAEPELTRPWSVLRGDLPAALNKRYFTEEVRGATLLYAGPGVKTPAIRDEGGRLSTTDPNNPAIARDMVLIAAHRGWSTIQVRGEDDFRREVWMEARALGLEVRGWKPRQRDEQELAVRLQPRAERASRADGERTAPGGEPASRARSDRVDFVAGVSGRLLEAGEAPYQRRAGGESTPFLRLEQPSGKPVEIWGVTLPDALAKSGAQIGDQILVRREGVEHVMKTIKETDPQTGRTTTERKEVPRNRWVIEAERMHEATPAQAARDPALRNAQSHLAVVQVVAGDRLKDPASVERVMARSKQQVVEQLAEGRQFAPARVRAEDRVASRAARPEPALDLAERAPADHGRERTRKR